MPCCLHHRKLSRRHFLSAAASTGVATTIPGVASAGLFPAGEPAERMKDVFRQAGGSKLGRIETFRITPADLPWRLKLLDVKKDQPVTMLLGGRWYVSREADIWFEPGFVLHARVADGPMFNPMHNTGTFTADRDGELRVARAAADWANAEGELWTAEEDYIAGDGFIDGVAIAWNVDPIEGLERMAAEGDIAGLIREEIDRLKSPPVTPKGWENHFSFGEAGIFTLYDGKEGPEIACSTHKDVSILRKPLELSLAEPLKLRWDWLVDELPSLHPENSAATHDYLSIGVEFDDGQDITYLWSVGLEPGLVFRCPLPGWNAIETHVVQRSGRADFGRWMSEERDIKADYESIIGGGAQNIVRIWLLGVSPFQRRRGTCRYRKISVAGDHGVAQVL
ncbi:MAG: DUF3047 domain-containing protein [Pseudomonadota bacterium]